MKTVKIASKILKVITDLEKQISGDVESNLDPIYKLIEEMTKISHPTSEEFKRFESIRKDIIKRCEKIESSVHELITILTKIRGLE